jgi:hypothetical protein
MPRIAVLVATDRDPVGAQSLTWLRFISREQLHTNGCANLLSCLTRCLVQQIGLTGSKR